MLGENREVLDKIAEFLIAKETITGEEFMKIYRDVKGEDITETHSQDTDDGKTDIASKDVSDKDESLQDKVDNDVVVKSEVSDGLAVKADIIEDDLD